MLHFTSPWLFCNYQFVLLNPFTNLTQSSNPLPLWQSPIQSLCLWICFKQKEYWWSMRTPTQLKRRLPMVPGSKCVAKNKCTCLTLSSAPQPGWLSGARASWQLEGQEGLAIPLSNTTNMHNYKSLCSLWDFQAIISCIYIYEVKHLKILTEFLWVIISWKEKEKINWILCFSKAVNFNKQVICPTPSSRGNHLKTPQHKASNKTSLWEL